MQDAALTRNRCDDFTEEDWDVIAAIQESFEVAFTYDELNQLRTIQEVYDCVSKKLGCETSEKCLSAVTFYRIRRALIEICGIPRSAVTPQKSLANVMPIWKRRKRWWQLEDALNRSIPSLEYYPAVPIASLLATCALLPLLASYFSAGSTLDFGPGFNPRHIHFSRDRLWMGWIGAVLMGFNLWGISIYWLLKPLALRFPRTCQTVGDLTKNVVAYNFTIIAKGARGWSGRELMESLQFVVAEQAGCSIDEVRPENAFPY